MQISVVGELGRAVRGKRKALALTQADAAAACGVGTRFFSELENGKPTLHIGKVLRVAEGLGLELFVGERGLPGVAIGER